MNEWMTNRMLDTGWTDWVTDWLIDWLDEWMNDWLSDWLSDWLLQFRSCDPLGRQRHTIFYLNSSAFFKLSFHPSLYNIFLCAPSNCPQVPLVFFTLIRFSLFISIIKWFLSDYILFAFLHITQKFRSGEHHSALWIHARPHNFLYPIVILRHSDSVECYELFVYSNLFIILRQTIIVW